MKTIKFLFPLFLCLLLFTGCWDKVEIDDRNYVITMGIDRFDPETENFPSEEQKNRFTVTLGTAELSQPKEGEKNQDKEQTKKGGSLSGESLASAMKLADLYGSRQVYYGQMKAVIFGREILEDKVLLQEALDTLERDQEINMKIIILGTNGKASDCVNAISGENQPTGLYLWEFYKNNAKEVAATQKLDFETLLVSLRSNKNAILPKVSVQEEKLDLGGGLILKDFTLVGELNETQERGVLLIDGNAEGAIFNEKIDNIPIPLRIIKNTSKMTFESKGENIICNISIEVKGTIEGSSMEKDLFSHSSLEKISDIFELSIQNEAEDSLSLLQKQYQTDAMDFSGMLKKKAYSIYKQYSGSQDVLFQNMEFDVQVHVDLDGIGMIH